MASFVARPRVFPNQSPVVAGAARLAWHGWCSLSARAMIILGFDTSLASCSAAVCDAAAGLILASRSAAMERGQAEALAPMLRDVMNEANIPFDRLDRIAVTVGPGAFTGVRIGLSMARGLGLALDVPVVAIGTLEAIAFNASPGLPLAVACDARRDQIYFALPPADAKVLFLPEAVQLLPGTPARLLGNASERLIMAAARSDLARDRSGDVPDAARFILAAASREPGVRPPEPVYLRLPDAKPSAPGQGVTTRLATAAEKALLSALHGECFDMPWGQSEFARLLAMPGAVAILAFRAGEPLGFILLRQAAEEAEILTIGTRPKARRQGIARRLIGEGLGHAAKARHVFIEVGAGNAAARALYAGLGFIRAGERKAYYRRADGRQEDAVVMRRDLGR